MQISAAFLLLTLILFSACSSVAQQSSADVVDFQHNQLRWQEAELINYDLSYQKHCYCLPDDLRPMRVEIRGGEIEQAFFADDNTPVQMGDIELETVSSLFVLIGKALDKPAYKIDVNYDPVFSYPQSISIDYHQRMVDDEISFSNIKVVKR